MKNKNKIIIISILTVVIVLITVLAITLTSNNKSTNKASNTIDNTDDNLEAEYANNKATIQLGNNIKIEGNGAKVDGNNVIITSGGEYTISGTLDNGMIEVNTIEEQKVILNLNNTSIKNSNGPAICVTNAKKAIIVLTGNNTLEDGEEYDIDAKATLFSNDTLKIKGEGTLEVIGNYKHAIASDDDVIIEDGDIVLSAIVDGIHVNDGVQIDGGNITVTTAHDAIESEGIIIINNGIFNLSCEDDGITSQGDFTINGGTYNITKCEEGIESKSQLIINDGLIEVLANDDGLNAKYIEINEGKIYCNSKNGDAIDSNGTVKITGGIIVAVGGNVPEGGLDFDNNTCEITGGTLIATGGVNSTPTESKCEQPIILFGNLGSNSNIRIQDESGEEIITFRIEKTYQSLIVTTPKLKSNTNYVVYTNGEVADTEEFHGLYLSETTYSNGEENTSFTTETIITNLGGNTSMMGGGMVPGGKGQKGEMDMNGMTPPDMGEMPLGMNEDNKNFKPNKSNKMSNEELNFNNI